jgi:hypothetical protein
VVRFRCGEGQTGADIFLLEIGKIARHFSFGYTSREKLMASQISIEAALLNLDFTTLDGLRGKTVIFGVISIGDPAPEPLQLPMLETTVATQSTAKIAWRNGLHAEPSPSAVPGECSLVFISPSEIELDTDIVAVMPAGAADGVADPKIHSFDGAR